MNFSFGNWRKRRKPAQLPERNGILMDTRALYKRVLLEAPMPQSEFFEYLNDTVRALGARYGQRFVAQEGSSLSPVESLDGQSGVRDIYFTPVLDNIVYMKNKDEDRKTDSLTGAEHAYRTVWRERMSGKRVRGERW